MAQPEEHIRASSRPLSIRAFADLAETSPRRIRRLVRQGRLQTTVNSTGETRIPESELSRLEGEKQNRLLKQSMELQPLNTALEADYDHDLEGSYPNIGGGAVVSLQRHEAAMVRLGYLESELATTRRMLTDAAERQKELAERTDEAEQDVVSATVRAVEAENALEEMRSQVIESTFRAMELKKEVEELRASLNQPWWKRMFGKGSSEADADPS